MTLILTLATRNAVVQAADRRLTVMPTGKVVDDDACKVVFQGSRMVLAYTGLANVSRGPTDIWMAQRLAEMRALPVREGFELLAEEATREWPRIRAPLRLKSHAFVGAGWDGRRAFIATVTNVYSRTGAWERQPRNRFQVYLDWLGIAQELRFSAVGVSIDEIRRSVKDSIRAKLRADASDEELSSLLGRVVRYVAKRNTGVGESMFLSIVPRGGTPSGRLEVPMPGTEPLILGSGDAPPARSLFLPNPAAPRVHHAPHYVSEFGLQFGISAEHGRAMGPEEIRRRYLAQKARHERLFR